MKYQNNQLYCECQLVALWNAARFYGIDVPTIGTKQYKCICDESGCLYGGCININKEISRLGLKIIPGRTDILWVRKNIPVHFAIFCHRGYHSVLAIDVVGRNVKLANYAHNRLHSLSWDVLKSKKNERVRPYSYKLV
jgi:hypothetical protein